jgi:DNA invertase Pin-like site-specific DNA recombinase
MAIKPAEVHRFMPANQAAIYVRISKDREGLELGVERQEEDCRKIAERLNLPVYRVYKDNDLSGSKFARKARPDYQQMLEDARAGYFSTIIAYKSSRLTRRPREHEGQIELAEDYGIRYLFVASPAFDLNTASGRLVARILAAQDAATAEETSELIARKKLERAQQGQYLGGYRAYGYEGPQYDDDGTLLNRGRINIAIVQEEADTYRLIVKRIIAGERIATIVRDLNAQGIPSPDGKQWSYGNTKRILLKQRYVIFDDTDTERRGTLEHHGQTYRASWPGLISRDEYELMKARLTAVSQNWKHGLSEGRKYLLTGFTVCGLCGTACYGSGKILKGQYQRRYRCRDRDNSGNNVGCGKVFRGADPLEDYITAQVMERLDSTEVRASLLDGSDGDDELIAELLTKLDSQREHRKQLLIDHGQGLYSRSDFQVILDAADDAIALTQAHLAKARNSEVVSLLPADQPVRELWPSASIDWQRQIVRLVIEKVVIKPGHPGSKLYKEWRFNVDDIEIVWRQSNSAELSDRLATLLATQRRSLALAA